MQVVSSATPWILAVIAGVAIATSHLGDRVALAARDISLTAEAAAEALEGEDECQSSFEGGSCALSAMQLRGKSVSSAAAHVDAPEDELEAEFRIGGSDPTQLSFEEEEEALEENVEDEVDDNEAEEQISQDDFVTAGESGGSSLLDLTPVDKVPVTGCHGENGTACPNGEVCIVRYDGTPVTSETWSQCFSCSTATFGQECQKLDDYLRYAAVRTCKQTCVDTKCYNKNWCFKPYRCIVDKEAQWGQCINCHSKKYWSASCYASPPGLRKAASKTCHRRCR